MRDPLARVPIRYKLPLGFLAICLVAFGVGGVILTTAARQALEEQIDRRLDERLIATELVVERHLELYGRRVEDFASDGFIRTHVAALGASEDPAADADRVRSLTRHLLKNKLPLDEALVGAHAYDAQGRVLVSIPAEAPAHPDRATTGSLAVDEIVRAGGAHPYPTFRIATPLQRITGGDRIGALELVVRADIWLGGMREMERLPPLPLRAAHILGGGEVQLSLLPAGTIGQGRPPAAGSRRPVAGTSWELELDIDRARAMAPADRLRRQYYGIGAALLAITAAVLFFPLRFLLAPLSHIAEAARRMARGDFATRVDHQSGDEIGDLARAFNVMAGAVDDRTQRLERAADSLKSREQEVREERNRLDAVIRSMEDGLFILDSDSRVTLANASARPLLHALTSPDSRRLECAHALGTERTCLSCLGQTLRGQQSCIVESGGRIYDIHTTTLPAVPGAQASRLCVSRDVTERIARQEGQAHQERMAVLGEIAAVMAHELNNPLAAISMFGEMLEEKLEGSPTEQESAIVIRRNAASCSRTISRLLDLAARGRFEFSQFDMHDLVQDVVSILRPLSQRAGVTVHVGAGAEDPAVVGDEHRLRQVLINLVMNGVQACEQGSRVEVAIRDADEALEIEVRDEGSGIPEDVADRVFEPFFTTKGAGVGTGLGLPTSRRIVEEHGGTLTLIETGSGGTVFRVTLPRRAARRMWEAQARRAADVGSAALESSS